MKKLAVVLCVMFIAGCSGVHLKEDSVSVDLRKNVFFDNPVWESDNFHKKFGRTADKSDGIKINKLLSDTHSLAGLAEQVLGESFERNRSSFPVQSSYKRGDKSKTQTRFYIETSNPLPENIAKSPVTNAVVHSMVKSYAGARRLPEKEIMIKNLTVSLEDFKEFQYQLIKESIKSYTSMEHDFAERKEDKTDTITIKWDMLFKKYITAHYNGEFIDRTGKKSSKLNVDLTITNETITDLFYIFLEALWDWALIDNEVKCPILYDKTKNKFLTAKNNVPTLYRFLEDVSSQENNKEEIILIDGVVEEVIEDMVGKEPNIMAGISRLELCVVRHVSGLSGDGAKTITGSIVRAFGGANLGFTLGLGALGKLSFGDNDTLTKVVDTWAESTGRRATESFASDTFYDSYFNNVNLINSLKMICGEKKSK